MLTEQLVCVHRHYEHLHISCFYDKVGNGPAAKLPVRLDGCPLGFVSTHVAQQWCTWYCITKEV